MKLKTETIEKIDETKSLFFEKTNIIEKTQNSDKEKREKTQTSDIRNKTRYPAGSKRLIRGC